jgi:hypothetical protein
MTAFGAAGLLLLAAGPTGISNDAVAREAAPQSCRIEREGAGIALSAPAFVFRLDTAEGAAGEAVFELTADEPPATVTHRRDAKQPVLRKSVKITNTGKTQWDRLFNVRLGTYTTSARLSGATLGSRTETELVKDHFQLI